MKRICIVIVSFMSLGFSIGNNDFLPKLDVARKLADGTSSAFTHFNGSGTANKVIDNHDGYVYSKGDAFWAPYTTESNLVLVEEQFWFTPGIVAHTQNASAFNDGVSLGKGIIDFAVKKCVSEDGSSRGGSVSVKTFWPQSSDVVTVLTSSYGGSLSGSSAFKKE